MPEGDASVRFLNAIPRADGPSRTATSHESHMPYRAGDASSGLDGGIAHLAAVVSEPRAECPPRTEESLRAERSHRDPEHLAPSQRPLAKARAAFASALDAIMHEHWLRGEGAYSNVAVARVCGVDEKTIRQWRDGVKPIPAAALVLLPGTLFEELMGHVAGARGRTPRRAMTQLRDALTALDSQISNEDPREVGRALDDAQERLFGLARKVREGSK